MCSLESRYGQQSTLRCLEEVCWHSSLCVDFSASPLIHDISDVDEIEALKQDLEKAGTGSNLETLAIGGANSSNDERKKAASQLAGTP